MNKYTLVFRDAEIQKEYVSSKHEEISSSYQKIYFFTMLALGCVFFGERSKEQSQSQEIIILTCVIGFNFICFISSFFMKKQFVYINLVFQVLSQAVLWIGSAYTDSKLEQSFIMFSLGQI